MSKKNRPSGASAEAPASSHFDVLKAFAICDGQNCCGHIMPRGPLGFEAFDRDDRSIGLFSDRRRAADALMKVAHGQA